MSVLIVTAVCVAAVWQEVRYARDAARLAEVRSADLRARIAEYSARPEWSRINGLGTVRHEGCNPSNLQGSGRRSS